MQKIFAAAYAAMSVFALTSSAEAAVTVNFEILGDSNRPGTVTGKLIFDTTGNNVAASELYILSIAPLLTSTAFLNKNLLGNGDIATYNSFSVSDSGVVTAANFSLFAYDSNRVAIDIANANNRGANGLFNYSNGTLIYNFNGLSGVKFTVDAAAAAVPEPATWAMMILGFGAVGYSMRRRQKAAARFA